VCRTESQGPESRWKGRGLPFFREKSLRTQRWKRATALSRGTNKVLAFRPNVVFRNRCGLLLSQHKRIPTSYGPRGGLTIRNFNGAQGN